MPVLLFIAAILGGALLFTRRASAAVNPNPSPVLKTNPLKDAPRTRGERNNNPGNIREGSAQWQGEVPGRDAAFEEFATPELGIRALAVLLRNYQRIHRLRTIRQIITRYAPPTENNTEAYILAVSRAMEVQPGLPVDLEDNATLAKMVRAVIHHENGRVIYSDETIAQAVALA